MMSIDSNKKIIGTSISRMIALAFTVIVFAGVGTVSIAAQEAGVKMSLADCIEAALSNNPDIEIEKINLIDSQLDVTIQEADFDADFSTGFSYADSRRPSASATAASRRKTTTFETAYGRDLKTGDSYELSLSQVKNESNATNSTLNPYYTIDLELAYTHPLGQGRGREVTLTALRISQLSTEMSEVALRDEVLDTVYVVESAYWDLVYAREALAVRKESLELARNTLERTMALVDAGALAESQILLVESQQAERQEDVISAVGDVRQAVLNLKLAMKTEIGTDLWNEGIIPGGPVTEAVGFEPLELEKALDTALKARPDFILSNLSLKMSELATVAARDDLKPSLDLEASVGIGSLRRDYSDSAQDIAQLDNPTWQLGLWMDIPVGRREAKARLEKSLGEEEIARLEIEDTRRQIAVAIADAQVRIETAENRMKAAAVTREYAEQKLKEEEEKHALGIATTHDVLEYQEDLAVARLNESGAVIDFNTAVTYYYYVLGTLTEEKGIDLFAEDIKIIR